MSVYDSTFADQFWSKVHQTEGCWFWLRTTDRDGYGVLTIGGRQRRAAQVAWELVNDSPFPTGMQACHHCDTPGCVRPDHIFVGTNQDNTRDSTEKGRRATGDRNGKRTHPESVIRGEQHGRAKLTENEVIAIRSRYAQGDIGHRRLAADYGLSPAGLRFILIRRTWRHI